MAPDTGLISIWKRCTVTEGERAPRLSDVGFPLHGLLVFLTLVSRAVRRLSLAVILLPVPHLVWIFRLSPFVLLCEFALTRQESVVYKVSDEEPNTGQDHHGPAAEVHVLVVFGDVDEFPCETTKRFL